MIDITTYLNRITSQHKTKPKYMALVEARLQPFIDLARCLESFDAAFDLETAVGTQLDIIGQFVGLNRLLTFQPEGGISPLLQDDMYRILLKAKISKNNWDGTATGMYKLWETLFPEYTVLIRDNQDMTMTVYTDMSTPFLLAQLIQHEYIIPKPMGVRFNYIFLEKEVVEVNDYEGAALSEYIRTFFIEDWIRIVTDVTDSHAAALHEYTRELFIEETEIITDNTDYHAVVVHELTRELFIADGDNIQSDAIDFDAVAITTIIRENFIGGDE